MFNNLGWQEIMLLALLGLVIFGPDRLPKAIADLGKTLRQLRALARNTANDLRTELGPELSDMDLRGLHPRRFVEDALFGEDDGSTPATRSRPAAPVLQADERPPYDADAT
jgi:sec-independent protein translocase protein TatB